MKGFTRTITFSNQTVAGRQQQLQQPARLFKTSTTARESISNGSNGLLSNKNPSKVSSATPASRHQQRKQSTTRANFLASAIGQQQALKQQPKIQMNIEPALAQPSHHQEILDETFKVAPASRPSYSAAQNQDRDDDEAAGLGSSSSSSQPNPSNNRSLQTLKTQDKFADRHIGPREGDLVAMLNTLGYSTLDQLINDTIPDEIRLDRPLSLPEALSEHELLEELKVLAAHNKSTEWKSYIGLGYYDCIVPSVILRNIFENPGWTTAYTAYQAEIAQGRLESLMNFQTMVSDMTGLDVANASLLDESTAAAEAMQVCYRVDTKLKRQKFLMSRHCHPQTKAVVETRAQALDIQVDYFDELELLKDTPSAGSGAGDSKQPDFSQYCGVLVQYPNTEGFLFDLDRITKPCQAGGCLVAVATDLLACTLFKPPGDFEQPADLVVGSAQRFGVPLNFGGPHAGFLACRQKLIRSIPGRVVGMTRDSNGNPAYRFALQTREQHIRRDKATSNICTAQALLANMSAMYAIYHGPEGLRRIASAIHLKTSLLAHLIKKEPQLELVNDGAFFDTLTIGLTGGAKQLASLRARANEAKVNLRYVADSVDGDVDSNTGHYQPRVMISLDETTKILDVFKLASLFAEGGNKANNYSDNSATHLAQSALSLATIHDNVGNQIELDPIEVPLENQLASMRRQSDFLTHPTFNSYHSEAQLVRYMKSLENKDISLAHSMIPLGSCTMKLNATSQMMASSWPEFVQCHPFQPLDQVRGYLRLFEDLNEYLCEITGYDRISFQPNSGAQGEYAGLRVIRAYLDSKGEFERNVCLIPASAHGTNPASAQMAGFQIQTVRVLDDGSIDMADFMAKLEQNKNKLACFMITYPSTFGVFEENIRRFCELVHEAGGQVYLDGANMNAQVGLCRPGDYGSDVSHLNLHKTFCIPHGGGGPGAGPIGVKSHLIPFLPSHPLVDGDGAQNLAAAATTKQSFGTVSSSMWGSPVILPISWSYIRMMSQELKRSSEVAILNANYMRKRLEDHYKILYRGSRGNVAHEFIIDCRPFKKTTNVEANDIAKRLQDFGLHAPTVSWPVANTLMLEPTESEDKQQLDDYCEALLQIRREIELIENGHWDREMNPIKQAPHTQQVVCSSDWSRPYTREEAAFPASFVKAATKIWPTVGRVDDTYGDTNLFCSCPPVDATNSELDGN
uniref:Glycine cleavage system P protein n=1 Tax=Aceria tosichella TaxID=561515 RepID=A0A6G1SIW9_9ACAR